MSWLNEPAEWSQEGGVQRAVTELRTDFWRRTCYGWETDNGHFHHRAVTGDFTAEVVVFACSPERAGLEATFRDLRIGPPISRENLE